MIFTCYNCLYKIQHNIIKAHDKNFCCTLCRNKYLTNNNYDINNIDKYMENKYLNITIIPYKNLSENNQYYLTNDNINYLKKNNNINNTTKLNTVNYIVSIKYNYEKHNVNNNNESYNESYNESFNVIKKRFIRTCDVFASFIYNICVIYI